MGSICDRLVWEWLRTIKRSSGVLTSGLSLKYCNCCCADPAPTWPRPHVTPPPRWPNIHELLVSRFYFIPNIRDIQCFSVSYWGGGASNQNREITPPQTYLHQTKPNTDGASRGGSKKKLNDPGGLVPDLEPAWTVCIWGLENLFDAR